MTLTEFLLARIAEDEALAIDVDAGGYNIDFGQGEAARRVADIFCRYPPGRVWSECEAKRRIVELHPVLSWTERETFASGPRCAACADNENADYDGAPLIDWPCPTLRLLALPYADHADYDETWRLV